MQNNVSYSRTQSLKQKERLLDQFSSTFQGQQLLASQRCNLQQNVLQKEKNNQPQCLKVNQHQEHLEKPHQPQLSEEMVNLAPEKQFLPCFSKISKRTLRSGKFQNLYLPKEISETPEINFDLRNEEPKNQHQNEHRKENNKMIKKIQKKKNKKQKRKAQPKKTVQKVKQEVKQEFNSCKCKYEYVKVYITIIDATTQTENQTSKESSNQTTNQSSKQSSNESQQTQKKVVIKRKTDQQRVKCNREKFQNKSSLGRKAYYLQMEEQLAFWAQKVLDAKRKLTQRKIRQKAMAILQSKGQAQNFKGSKGWLQKFFTRYPDIYQKMVISKKQNYEDIDEICGQELQRNRRLNEDSFDIVPLNLINAFELCLKQEQEDLIVHFD